MKRLALMLAIAITSSTALAEVTLRITPPTPPSITIVATPPRATTLVLSASINLWIPAGITVVSDTRTANEAIVVVQPTTTYVVTRPVYITTYERYVADFRARGYVVVKSTVNNGIARGEFRRGGEKVTIISRPRAKGAEVRVQTAGGPKFKPVPQGKAVGNKHK